MKTIESEKQDWLDLFTGNSREDQVFEQTILSGSMYPLLKPGRRLRLKSCPWQKCHIGEIIVFKMGKNLNVHRVLWKLSLGTRGLFLQKGDASPLGSFITSRQIAGKVIAVQDKDNKFHSLEETRSAARKRAGRELLRHLLAWGLLWPRGVKQWIKIKNKPV